LSGGSLYAYELPPMENIEPMTAEDEKTGKKSAIGLSEIQRGISTSKKINFIADSQVLRNYSIFVSH